MADQDKRRRPHAGFTLVELMLVVSIIGALATITIPVLMKYQLKSKTAEGKINLGAIRIAEETYFGEFQSYLAVDPEPTAIPGTQRTVFDAASSGFSILGFEPEGNVYFSYGVAISADSVGYTADAGADIDGNGIVQFWGYKRPDGSDAYVTGKVGCPVAGLAEQQIGPCDSTYGQSVF